VQGVVVLVTGRLVSDVRSLPDPVDRLTYQIGQLPGRRLICASGERGMLKQRVERLQQPPVAGTVELLDECCVRRPVPRRHLKLDPPPDRPEHQDLRHLVDEVA
jgi:hypothetical protein